MDDALLLAYLMFHLDIFSTSIIYNVDVQQSYCFLRQLVSNFFWTGSFLSRFVTVVLRLNSPVFCAVGGHQFWVHRWDHCICPLLFWAPCFRFQETRPALWFGSPSSVWLLLIIWRPRCSSSFSTNTCHLCLLQEQIAAKQWQFFQKMCQVPEYSKYAVT